MWISCEQYVDNLWISSPGSGYPQVIHNLSTPYPQVIHTISVKYRIVRSRIFQDNLLFFKLFKNKTSRGCLFRFIRVIYYKTVACNVVDNLWITLLRVYSSPSRFICFIIAWTRFEMISSFPIFSSTV